MAAADYYDDVQKVYIAYYGRPADAGGLLFWADQLESVGGNLTAIVEAFGNSAEANALFGGMTNAEMVNTIYQQLFNRDADPEGLAYYTNGLTTGQFTLASIMLDVLNGAKGGDVDNIQAKVAAAGEFTDVFFDGVNDVNETASYAGDANATIAREWLANVVDTASALDAGLQLAGTVGQMTGVTGPAHTFTLHEVVVSTEVVHTGPLMERVVMWGYNPHAHDETSGVDNLDGNDPDGNSNNLTNEGPEDGGVPLTTLLSTIQTLAGLDFVQLGLINVASGSDNGLDNGEEGTEGSSVQLALVDGITLTQNGDGTQTVTVTGTDGTVAQAEVQIAQEYFDLINNLLFDEEGNTRLYEVTRAVDVNDDGSDETVTTYAPIVLTTADNNGATIEGGVLTTAADDLIVAGRLELLHQAYIDGGAGYNILEVDAKGTYAQPLGLYNIQEVRVENLPNIYTTSYGSGDGYLSNSTYPDLSTSGGSDNSVLDLTRAIDIERLVITEGNGTGRDLGELTIVGVRGDAVTRFEGDFTEDVNVNYGEGQEGPLTVELLLGTVESSLNFASNADALHLVSMGTVNTFETTISGGTLAELTISGDGALYITNDLDSSFTDTHPVTIDASANKGGVNLTLTDSQNVTFIGSQGDDVFQVDTFDSSWSQNGGDTGLNDTSVTIVGGEGDNRYEVGFAAVVTVTNGDGNNNYEVDYAAIVDITSGDGNNFFEIDDAQAVSIAAGDGDNVVQVYAWNSDETAYPWEALEVPNKIDLTLGDGANNVALEADDTIGVITVNAGNGGNTIRAAAESVSITSGTGADVIKVLAGEITINSTGSGDQITISGIDYDYVDDSALVTINVGTDATITLGDDGQTDSDELDTFPTDSGFFVAKQGSSITGTDITLVVNTQADLQAATLTGITKVVLDDDNGDYSDSDGANTANAEGAADNAVLTLTSTQFKAIGAANFSVDGSLFGTHAFVKIIVDETTSLTDLGVAGLDRNIDLYLELQDGVTLTMTAQQLHEHVAQNGITLVSDDNTDVVSGKVVINGGGLDFDPFNTSDTVSSVIDGSVYYGGSLSDDFMVGGSWYNIKVNSLVNGYDRPADDAADVVLTLDSTGTLPLEQAGFTTTMHNNLQVVGDQDITFTGDINLGENFTIDFSELEGTVTNMTIAQFQDVKQIRGNGDATVYVKLENKNNGSTGDGTQPGVDSTDENEAGGGELANPTVASDEEGLKSSGVAKYIVTDIVDISPSEVGEIYLCDNTEDLEVIGLRANWSATLEVHNVGWGTNFELQGGSTKKADGPTGTSNVGMLHADYEHEGADAVVTLTHSVAGDTRDIMAYGIIIDNADSITVNAGASSAIIDHVTGDDVSELNFSSDANITITDTLDLDGLSSVDGANVDGSFTLSLTGDAEGFAFVASAGTTTLSLNDVSADHHSSFVAEDAATFNLVVNGSTDLSEATLTNVDALSLGTIGDASANSVTLTITQVLAIGAGDITLTHHDLDGTLNLVNLGSEAFDAGDLGDGVMLGTVTVASGDVTINTATVLTDATVTVAAGSSLTLTADQFMALEDLDGVAPGAVINITGLTQAHIDAGFTLAGVSNATGSVSLAEDVALDDATNLNGFSVTLADGQTIALATVDQADGLEVNGGANTTVKILFNDNGGDRIDASGYDVTTLLFPADLVADMNVDNVFLDLPQDVVKTIYNSLVELVDQTVTLLAGVTVNGDMNFNHRDGTVELQDFTLNLTGGNVIDGEINLSVSEKDDGLLQTYLDSVTINSTGTAGNLLTGETDNIITGDLSTQQETSNASSNNRIDNELLNVTINASQNLQLQGSIIFEAEINSDEVATLTVTGTADVTIGSLDTSSNEVDGLDVINNGTGTLSVGIDAADIDAADDLSFTGTGDIVLNVTGTVDLSDDDLSAVSQLVLANGAIVTLTMAQGDAIGAGNIMAASGAAATLNLEGLDGEPFAVANYGDGITVNLLTLADLPVITLHATTDLTGIAGLVVPEGTVLNLTAEQFQQLTDGTITGIDADGNPSTEFTVNITDLMQADVADGFDLSGITADNLTVTLAESVELDSTETNDLNGADIAIGAFTFTLYSVALADGLDITGTGVLKFTDIVVDDPADYIDASGFAVSELHMEAQLIAGENVDELFAGLAESVVKVVTDEYGYVVGTDQTVVIEAGSTISGDVAFIKQEGDVEILNFTMSLEGGVYLGGDVNLSKDNGDTGIPAYLQTVTINSTGTAANVINGETANVITGDLTTQAFNGSAVENNLLDVTINASQDLVIEGDVVFNSVTNGDYNDGVTANDIDDAVAVLTVNGTADVTLGGVDLTDTDVDGLDVVNNGTGVVSLTLDTADSDEDLSFTGTGEVDLTVEGIVDLSDDVLTAVDHVTVAEEAELTLSFAQLSAIGAANIVVADTEDDLDEALNVVEYDGSDFDFSALSDELVINIVMASGNIVLDPAVDLTGVESITVPEGGTLTLTAAQFEQLNGNGTIVGVEADGVTVTTNISVVITDLAQANVDLDLNDDGDTADAGEGFDLSDVDADNISVSLAEDVNLDDNTVLNGASLEIAGFHLGLSDQTQADGLVVTGNASSIVTFMFDIVGPIDAAGYDVGTVRALATSVDGEDVEFLIDNLASDVTLNLYETPDELGFVSPINRVVTIEEGVAVPGSIVFNGQDDDREVRTLTINFTGDATDRTELEDADGNIEGSVIAGSLILDLEPNDVTLVESKFMKLTINSTGVGDSNAITGDITPIAQLVINPGATVNEDNNLLDVEINADSAFTIGGSVIFNSTDADLDEATLTVNGPAAVTIENLDVTDADIDVLNVAVNDGATLTVTGASPSIEADATESIIFSGNGDVVLGSVEDPENYEDGIAGGEDLSLVDASDLSGDLSIENITAVDVANFSFVSGTGVTNVRISDSTLNDDDAPNAEPGWSFDLSNADTGSQLTFGSGLVWTDGDLVVDLGADAVLYITEDTDWTALDNVDIQGTIILAAGVDLVLTAAMADGLTIIPEASIIMDEADADFEVADVPTVTITELGGAAYDFSEIMAGAQDDILPGTVLVANAYLAADADDVADVTIHAATNLGDVAISLIDVADGVAANDDLAGQTVRFNTVAQAERIIVVEGGLAGAASTNVVWLFETIAAPVDTGDYDANIARLWVTEELITSEGGDVEQLFTTLPDSILRVDFADVTELDVLLVSESVDRVVEFVHFSTPGNLTFSDVGLDPIEHVESLTLNLGGEVVLGNINLNDDLPVTVDPASVMFTELTINSQRALHQDHLLASEFFVNDNDGDDETGEHQQPDAINTIGDIGVGGNLDLLTVNLRTFEDVDPTLLAGQGVQPNAGAALVIDTITFDSGVAGETAELDIEGDNNITITAIDTSDADIVALMIDATDFTAILDPVMHLDNTEALILDNDDVAAGTITLEEIEGNELSHIDASGFDGTLNITLSQIDSADDLVSDIDGDGDTTGVLPGEYEEANDAFTFLAGGGISTVVVQQVGANIPTLNAGSTWSFDFTGAAAGSTLTIDDTAVLAAGSTLMVDLDGVAELIIDGDLDLTGVTLIITGGNIQVPAGQSLTLTLAQVQALDAAGGVLIVGEGTVAVTGDATDEATATFDDPLRTANVDFSGITLDLVAPGADATLAFEAELLGGFMVDGTTAIGQSVVGSANDDAITTADDHDNTLNGMAGDDTLTGGTDTVALPDGTFNTYVVASGTDTIVGLMGPAPVVVTDPQVSDVINASGVTTTVLADVEGDFIATAATTNNGATVELTGTGEVDQTIDMSAATVTGTVGFTLTGNDDTGILVDGVDTLIGSDEDDIINGGNWDQAMAAQADVLTGNAGDDQFVFNTSVNSAATLTVATTTTAIDREIITFVADDNFGEGEELTIDYTVNGIAGQVVLDVSAIANDAPAIAAAAIVALDAKAGISAVSGGGNDVVIAGDNGASVGNVAVAVSNGTATTLAGNWTNGTDQDQVSTITVSGTATMNDLYSIIVAYNGGGGTTDDYTAVGADTSDIVAAGLDDLLSEAEVVALAAASVVTFTDQDGDNGGFSITTDTTAAFGGSGASENGGTASGDGMPDYLTADVITDFVSGSDTISFGLAAGAGNYSEAAVVADYATALIAADAIFDGTVQYYLTSATDLDGAGGSGTVQGQEGAGLLFADANLDGTTDLVVLLIGVNSSSFVATDIVA